MVGRDWCDDNKGKVGARRAVLRFRLGSVSAASCGSDQQRRRAVHKGSVGRPASPRELNARASQQALEAFEDNLAIPEGELPEPPVLSDALSADVACPNRRDAASRVFDKRSCDGSDRAEARSSRGAAREAL